MTLGRRIQSIVTVVVMATAAHRPATGTTQCHHDPMEQASLWRFLHPDTPIESPDTIGLGVELFSGSASSQGCIDLGGAAEVEGNDRWSGSFGLQGTNGSVYAVAVRDGVIYIGGAFTSAGGVAVNNVAAWSGDGWASVGSGADAPVFAITPSDSGVYVGGGFDVAGGTSAHGIAHWNGSGWVALGDGVNGHVYSIIEMGDDVYVGGDFTVAGAAATGVARWDGATSPPKRSCSRSMTPSSARLRRRAESSKSVV